MDFDTQLSQLCAGDGILIQCNNLYVYSNGFYPPFLKVKQHLQIEGMIFHIYSVQFDNEEILITDHQDNLQFSQDIVIKQAKSNKCISVILHQDQWTLSLQDKADRTSLFRIEPCYKSQIQNSNRISYDDDVFIMFSPENTALSGFESQDLFAVAPDGNSLKKQNNFTLQTTKTTKFQLRKVAQQKQGLYYGGLIKIKQIEKDAHLELTTIENMQSNDYNNNVHLTDVKSQYQRIYSSNRVVGWRCREKKQQNIDLLQYDIWRLHHPQKIHQTIKQGDSFFLQNLSGNFFLAGDSVTQNLKEASLFNFVEQESINSTLYYLTTNDQILTYKNSKEINFGQVQDRYQIEYREKKSKYDLLQFEVVSNVNITHQNWLDNIVKLISQTHSYFFKNSEEIHSFLKNQLINDGKFDDLFDLLEQLENAINDLTLFCIDGEEKPKILDKNGILYLQMNTYNQGLIRKKMIVQQLISLMDIIKWDYQYTQIMEQLQNSKRNISLEDLNLQLLFQINNVINQAFIFFEAFSSHNDPNSQMIFIAYFQLKQLLGYNVGAFYCLIRLFAKNQNLIPIAGMMPFLNVSEKEQDFTLIKRSTRINTVFTKQQNLLQSATLIDEIFERAQYCQKILNKKFWANVVKTLGVLCLQNDKACFNNQMIIGRRIIQGPNIMLQFLTQGEILFVEIEGQRYELNEIYLQSSKANFDFMNEILECRNFLDSQLHLIGLLCQERNYENIQYYRAKLSQKTLTSYISNSRNDEQLRCRLIIILMNLYVDSYPYQPKQMPKLIFNLNKILDKNQQNGSTHLDQSQLEMTEITSKQFSKQLTRQFTLNDTLSIEKLLNITQELVKLNLIQQNQLNLSLSVSKILKMFYKLYTFNLPQNKEFHEKYFDINLLIQAYTLLPNSLQQTQPLQEKFQEHIQFQEEKEIFNSMAIVLIEFLMLYFEKVETKILEMSIKFSENQDSLTIINSQNRFDKIKENTFHLLKHKQSSPETKLMAFKLIETMHQPKRNIVKRLKRCLFLENTDQLQNYAYLKQTILQLRELESAVDKQPLYRSCIKSLQDLNKLMTLTSNPLLMQKMLRILNVDFILLDFLDSYSSVCCLITQKYIRSNKDDRYQLQLNEEEEDIKLFCTQSLSILKQFCQGNQRNKLRILSKFNLFDDLLKCIELGQYELLVEIYKDSQENIQSASNRIIYLLLDNLNLGSLKVLEALLEQQNTICQKNVEIIITQITTGKQFLQTLGFKDQSIETNLSQLAHSTFQVQLSLGSMPYVIQIYAIEFILKTLRCQSQHGQKILQNHLPTRKILINILSLKDLFRHKVDNLDKAILSTILKQQFLKLFNQLLNFKDIVKYDDEIQELLIKFLDQEIKIFNAKIVKLNYDECKQLYDADKRYDVIVKNFGFKILQTASQDQQFFKQVDSGSSESEDSSGGIGNESLKQIACFSLQDYFQFIQFNNYALLLFDLFLSLAQLIQELIDNLEDTSNKSGRASSSFARQMSLSQDMSAIDMNQSIKMKPYSNLKNKIDSFSKLLEEYLNQNLSKWEIIDNGNFLIEKQQILKILFYRKLDLVNFNLDQILPKKQTVTLDVFCSPNYFYDKRIHELILLSEKAENEGFVVKQINCIMSTSDELGNENFKMYSEIYSQQLLMNEDFEIILENFPNIIVPLVSCFQSSMNNIPKNYKALISMLRFFSQLIDIHTYIRENYAQTLKVYKMNKRGKYNTKSEQILQIKALKYLQNLLVNQGFFTVFIQFCNLFDKIRIISFSELGVKNNYKKEKLFYHFLLVSIRLVRGIEQANQVAQQNLMLEIQRTKSNYLLKIFASIFERSFNLDEFQQQRMQLQNEIERIYLSYEFNETHRLEQKKYSMKLGILQIQMRFLQLLAEDHYRPFQDFFREQTGFPQNYDILQYLINILLTYFNNESFYSLSQDDYILILNCFDCIKEFIQGPCPQNQEKICTPPFLRLCFKLLSYDDSQFKFLTLYPQFSKPEQIAQKQDQERQRVSTQDFVRKQNYIQNKTTLQQNFIQFYIKNPKYCKYLVESFRRSNSANYKLYMLSEIKYRCATTLESLTDNDQNESDILKRISLIINEKVLIRNITIQYEKYKILHGSGKNYTNLVFKHLLGDEPKENKSNEQKIRKNKVSLMLQPNHYWYQVEEEITAEIAINDFWNSFIIETGFSLFNLLAQIYQMKDQDILERIYEQIDNTKSEKKSFKSIIFYNLYQSIFAASQITKNITQLQQSNKVNNKVFSVYKLKKATGEAEAQQKKLGYRALRFFATRTGSIEILLENKQLKKLMFPLVPHCFALNEEIKRKFASDIDRLSQQRKVESVLSNSSHIIQKLQTEYKFQTLYKKSFVVNLLASNQKLWKQIIFFVIVLENIMILFSSDGQIQKVFSDILFGLTITQIILQFICFFIFIVKKLPYLRIKSEEIVFDRQINRIRKREIKYKYLDNSQSVVLQEDFVLEKTDSFLLEQNKWRRLFFNISDSLVLYKCILLDYEMIYFLIFTSLAFIGLQYNIVLALLLLDVFWRFPTLTSIVNAIWRPSGQILLVLSLYIIMQYYYSLIVYHYYAEFYTPYCQNLLQCFSFILDVTFKTDGGSVGYVSSSDVYSDENYRYSILNFWEFVYVFVVISLLYSIITGIIIDSFGVLRDEAEELDNDIKGFCLICGIDRSTLEKKAKHKKGFRFHVKYEHCVWNYIFYISYLLDKKKSDYNGIESYVDSNLKKESINWFPINKSLSIPDEEDEQEGINNLKKNIEEKLIEISNKLDKN